MAIAVRELFDLSGAVSLVVGGAGHIGTEACKTLAELGSSVAVADLSEADPAAVTSDISSTFGVVARPYEVDLSVGDQVSALPDAVAADFGKIDIVIHTAGMVASGEVDGWVAPISQQSPAVWRLALEINLTSAFILLQASEKYLEQSPVASTILISSLSGMFGPDESIYEGTKMGSPAAYGVSKAGMLQLARTFATAWGGKIRCNSISPSGIERGQDPQFVERYVAKTPLGRMASEADLKGSIAYLASNTSRFVTGHNLIVDGGISIQY